MTNIAFLSLGTNMGDRLANLQAAIHQLSLTDSLEMKKVSSIYETEPVGYKEQANFLNMVVKIETMLSPELLLDRCLAIEKELGRVREIKWGPRTIDLDILLYNNDNIETEQLKIPHPRMHERAFVLIPLLEIEEDIHHPIFNTPLIQHLDKIFDKEGVRLWKQINGEDVSALFAN